MIRRALICLEEWALGDDSMILGLLKCFLLLAVVTSPIVYLLVKHDESEQSACMARGGGWAVVGQHAQTSVMMVGKVLIPQTILVTDYGCVAVARP